MINNLKISKNNEIPNFKNFFNIKKSDYWDYSIEIKINIIDELDIINLYSIIKSYIFNNILPCYSIATGTSDNDKYIIFNKSNLKQISKMSLNDFIEWYDFSLNYVKKYENKDNIIIFLIIFEKTICNIKKINLNELKPDYPWNENWIRYINLPSEKMFYNDKIFFKTINEYNDLLGFESMQMSIDSPNFEEILDMKIIKKDKSYYINFEKKQLDILINFIIIKMKYSIYYDIFLNDKYLKLNEIKEKVLENNVLIIKNIDRFDKTEKLLITPIFNNKEKTKIFFQKYISKWKFKNPDI